MDFDSTYESIKDVSKSSSNYSYTKKDDSSIYDQLVDFERLRLSALSKAAEISPLVKEITIGPRSPVKKEIRKDNYDIESKSKENIEENLIEDKIREEMRHSLLMKEYETKLQESSEDLFKNLIDKMISNRAETMRNYWKKQSEECERKALELRARKLQMLKELQENDNVNLLKRAQMDEKNSLIVNKQTIEIMNKILEEQNRATARFASVTDSHTKICVCYNEITNILQTEPQAKQVCDKYIASINAVLSNVSAIMDMCKSGAITDKEVKQAEVLASNLNNIRFKIIEDLNYNKQQREIQQKNEEEAAKQKELELKRAQDSKTVENVQKQINPTTGQQQSKTTKPIFYSLKNYSYYKDLRNFLEQYESQYKELLENVNLKKFRFDCQKAVNTPVNAISSVSSVHMRDKFDKLSKLLRGERVQVLDTYVTATQHPQGLYYCTALLAKKIVRQGDLLVSSNPEAAFPLAAVSVALWAQFPEFGKLLEANFHRQCPYLVPMLLPQKEGQTDKEFYESRGYSYNEEGVVEKQDKFLKRMSGIFRLCCAIWITKTPKFVNASNPHSLRYAWQWIASFVNLKPEPDICATLLHDFFIVCGSEFLKHYGKQFTKIIKLVSMEYLPILEKIDEGGPKTRLEVFLQTLLTTGNIPPPSGLLSLNSW